MRKMTKRKRKVLFTALALVVLLVGFVWTGIIQSMKLESTTYDLTIESANGQRGFVRIVHVSDLHSAVFGDHNEDLLALMASKEPDIICFTGDLVDASDPDDGVGTAFLTDAMAIAPVYYALGNHELSRTDTDETLRFLQEAGVHVLDNAVESIQVNGMPLVIGGATRVQYAPMLQRRYGPIDVLLCHYPEGIEVYGDTQIPLVLTGHAHGGQMRIPRLHISLYAPGQGVFPKYTQGVHAAGNTQMVISRGLGNSSFPFRAYNPPEVVVVNVTVVPGS